MGEDRSGRDRDAQEATSRKPFGRWIKVYVGLRRSAKWRRIPGGPRLEHFGALQLLSLYARENELDGVLSRSDVRRALDLSEEFDAESTARVVAELEVAGFLERSAGGVRLHEWGMHQTSEKQIRAAVENGKKGGRPRKPKETGSGSASGSARVSVGFPKTGPNEGREGHQNTSENRKSMSQNSEDTAVTDDVPGAAEKPDPVSNPVPDPVREVEVEWKISSTPCGVEEPASPARRGKKNRTPVEPTEHARVKALFLRNWARLSGKKPEDYYFGADENALLASKLAFYKRPKLEALIELAFVHRAPAFLWREGAVPTWKQLASQLVWLDSFKPGAASTGASAPRGTSALLRSILGGDHDEDSVPE